MNEDLLPFGVYYHEKKGFAIMEKAVEENREWQIDTNTLKRHPFLRLTANIVKSGTGRYFQEKILKGYEYWGEL